MFPILLPNPESIAFQSAMADAEIDYQQAIIKAREYDAGQQFVALTARARQFLGGDTGDTTQDWQRLRLNVCNIILSAIVDKLIVANFDSDEVAVEQTGPDGLPETIKPAAAYASRIWTLNRMDAKQRRVHEIALRDSEAFVIVDWSSPKQRARFTPFQRFVDGSVDGDGDGCKAFYRNDDPDQDLLFVTKRWPEVNFTATGAQTVRQRMTVYHPDRIEKYAGLPGAWNKTWDFDVVRVGANWEVRVDGGVVQVAATYQEGVELAQSLADSGRLPWPIPWLDKQDAPLGIPVAHFRSSYGMEAREAWPIQNAINKSLVDLMVESDMSAFRIMLAFGWEPIIPGSKTAANPYGTPLPIEPGRWMGSGNKDASAVAIPPGDLSQFLNLIDSLIYKAAMLTSTPISRFVTTKQVSAEGTQKQQDSPLLNKARSRQSELGDAWERVMEIAIRLENTFGKGGIDEMATLQTVWEPLEARDEAAELAKAETMKRLGLPLSIIAPVLGLTPAQVELWQAEADRRAEQVAQQFQPQGQTQEEPQAS